MRGLPARIAAAIGGWLSAGVATAQGALELARPDPGAPDIPAATAGGGPGAMAFVQMLVAVVVVAGLLKWGLPAALARFARRGGPSPIGSTIRVEESTGIPGGHLVVVAVRGKTLLLGTTGQAVNVLADLSDEAEAVRREPAFIDAVDAALGRAVVPMDDDQAREALDRLRRIAG